MDEDEARRRFALARVARLGTVTPRGAPHLVPVVFALAGDTLWTAVDDKPKRTRGLQRLANLAANPWVSVLVDHYEDDWTRLWWVRADGVAAVREADPVGQAALVSRYEHYQQHPPAGPFVEVRVSRWRWWSAV